MIDCIDNWRDLPLGVYLDILDVYADPLREDIDKQVGALALLTGRTDKDILDLPIAEYTALSAKASFLQEVPEKYPRAAASYKVGDLELIPTKDFAHITAAQYIDYQTFVGAMPEDETNYVQVLSCFLIPKGNKYNDGYDMDEVRKAIREIGVADVLGLTAFFFGKWAALIRSTRTYLCRSIKREKDPEKREKMEARLKDLGRFNFGGAGSTT